jgi:hypothetical protein
MPLTRVDETKTVDDAAAKISQQKADLAKAKIENMMSNMMSHSRARTSRCGSACRARLQSSLAVCLPLLRSASNDES